MMNKNIFSRLTGKKIIPGPLFFLLIHGIAAAQNMNSRKVIPLDSAWRFWLGDDPAARQPGFDDRSWRRVDLPMAGYSNTDSKDGNQL